MSDVAIVSHGNDSSLLNLIERASHDPDFDVSKLEALLRMQREVVHEQAKREFNRAMADAQSEMEPVIRDATNTHTNSKYAKLETIDRDMRPIYTRHGFSVRYGSAPCPREGWLRITCTVAHRGGYFEDHYLDGPPDSTGTQGRSNKTGIQAVGSTVTFLRRYLLTMAFNIVLADLDDDGEASRRSSPPRPKPLDRRTDEASDDPLDVPLGYEWLQNFDAALDKAATLQDVLRIANHRGTLAALDQAPADKKGHIKDKLKAAYERVKPREAPPSDPRVPSDAQAMLDEVAAMDLHRLEALSDDTGWCSRLADLFPPDAELVRELIDQRKAELSHGQTGTATQEPTKHG